MMNTSTSLRVRRGRALPIALVLVFGGMLAAGALPRIAQSRARDSERKQVNAAPTVFTEKVRKDALRERGITATTWDRERP